MSMDAKGTDAKGMDAKSMDAKGMDALEKEERWDIRENNKEGNN